MSILTSEILEMCWKTSGRQMPGGRVALRYGCSWPAPTRQKIAGGSESASVLLAAMALRHITIDG